jgi:hypothetical protein
VPFAEAFTAPRVLCETWGSGGLDLLESRDNSLTAHEILLQQALNNLGRADMAAAVACGRRFNRLRLLMFGRIPKYEGLAGLRLSFNPDASVPESKEAWIADAKIKHAGDLGFQDVIAGWEKKLGEEAGAESSSLESGAEPKPAGGWEVGRPLSVRLCLGLRQLRARLGCI